MVTATQVVYSVLAGLGLAVFMVGVVRLVQTSRPGPPSTRVAQPPSSSGAPASDVEDVGTSSGRAGGRGQTPRQRAADGVPRKSQTAGRDD